MQASPEVIQLFSCSTQLSTEFQLLKKLIYRQIKKFIALSLSDVVFIMLINNCWHFNIYEQDKFLAPLS